jgi:hypothetical protein
MRACPGYEPKTRIFVYASATFLATAMTLHDPNIIAIRSQIAPQAQKKRM